jgi:alpha-galactosidase
LRVRWNFAIPSKTLFCGDAWERTYGDSQWRSFDPGRMMPWYFWASLPDGRTGCCGVQVRPSCFAAWSADPAGITLWCDIRSGGKGVILNGRTLVVAQIKSSVYDGCSAFEAAREFCIQLCPDPIFPPTPVYGSNNWYYAYGDITEASVLEDCRYLAELTAGLSCRPFMTIDAGWQKLPHTYGGPWNEGNKNFPDMPQLAGKMKAFGVRPGIWYRPLYTHDTSLKKELFLKNTPYTLDPSHPEVTELVARDVSRFREWGFELIKHDFMTFDTTGRYAFDMHPWPCNNGWEFFDRNRTSAEILLDLLKTIRNAAGPVLIMGCNTIGHLAAGLQELSRAGDDTSGKRWDRTCKMGVNTVAFRSCQHRTFFDVDSDCVGITGSIPWKYNRQWAELAAASGCAFFVSPRPGILSAAEKDELKQLLAIASRGEIAAEPLDWMDNLRPERWIIHGKERHFQWEESDGGEPDFLP